MIWAVKEKIKSFTNIRHRNNYLSPPDSQQILHGLMLALAGLGRNRKQMGTPTEGSQAFSGVKFCRDRANTKACSVGKGCNTQ